MAAPAALGAAGAVLHPGVCPNRGRGTGGGAGEPLCAAAADYLDGTPFDASVFEGMPIFLNIWATWCSPCVTEMPILNELAQEYKDRIAIVGLHAESLTVSEEGELVNDEEKIALAIEMREKMNLTYALLNPERTLFILMNNPQYGLQVKALPTTWLVDGEGYVRQVIIGPRDKKGWEDVIDGFLTKIQAEPEDKGEGV